MRTRCFLLQIKLRFNNHRPHLADGHAIIEDPNEVLYKSGLPFSDRRLGRERVRLLRCNGTQDGQLPSTVGTFVPHEQGIDVLPLVEAVVKSIHIGLFPSSKSKG